jgi:RNA polymerase sigma factor (sigma-70 family)
MAEEKDDRETYRPMLLGAQRYLESLLEDKVPNSLLAADWEDFYRLYDDLIRRFVVAQGVPRSDVDDCVQEVWGEVATRLIKFDRPADRPGLRAWLYTIVRSKATNIFRGKARQPVDDLDPTKSDFGHGLGDTDSDPALLYEKQWEQAVLESVIGQLREELSETNSRLMQMRLVDHRSVEDVAAELSLSPDQVHARQHRIMKKLRSMVALYTGGAISSDA